MCGIVALLSRPQTDVRDRLLNGLKMLRNRGYDSCGMALCAQQPTNPWSWKAASGRITTGLLRGLEEEKSSSNTFNSLESLEQTLRSTCPAETVYPCGLAHTRWATHGGKSDVNAHPHTDADQRFFVVHNGVITNHTELRDRLKREGHILRTETDTEVVPFLVRDYLADAVGLEDTDEDPVMFAWRMTVASLEGTWALVMMDVTQPDRLYVAKHGAPLLLAASPGEDEMWLASEVSGFYPHAPKYYSLPEDSCLTLVRDQNTSVVFIYQPSGSRQRLPSYCVNRSGPSTENNCVSRSGSHSFVLHEAPKRELATLGPYAYWTEKEIREQPEKIWEALNRGGRLFQQGDQWYVKLGGLDRSQQRLSLVKHLVLAGCGTSYHAALFALPFFRKAGLFVTVQAVDAGEFALEDLPLTDNSTEVAVVVISQSGETKDCQRVVGLVRERCLLLGVINVVGSWLAREVGCGIYLNAGREVGVASTKSFTSQVTVLALLALWFGQNKNGLVQHRLAQTVWSWPQVFQAHIQRMEQWAEELVPTLLGKPQMFLLGRSHAHPLCLEGALKLKELTYQVAEGYPGGALKHGPFAMIDEAAATPIFLHIWQGPFRSHMISAMEEVKARGACPLVLTNDATLAADPRYAAVKFMVLTDVMDEATASFVSILLYQFLALKMSLAHGYHPDFPRHLAKVVTVDG
jgi:glucosamine--fructose-6-phosphate aminotransferase (isomerizing)